MENHSFYLPQQVWVGPISALAQFLEPFVDQKILALASQVGPKRQQTVLVGRSLLKFALLANGLITPQQPLPQLAYTSLHKPFFTDLPVHFNLSHSHGWIALALGAQPQGLDLEQIDTTRKLRQALLEKVLSSSELQYLQRLQAECESTAGSVLAHDPALGACREAALRPLNQAAYEFFFLQWTLKEALLKLQGASIFSLERLKFAPEQRVVQVSNAQALAAPVLPWFKELVSFKLSSLYALWGGLSVVPQDFWLTVGTYGALPQVMVLANPQQLPLVVQSYRFDAKCLQEGASTTNLPQGHTADVYAVGAPCMSVAIDHLNLAKKNLNLPPFIVKSEPFCSAALDLHGVSTLAQDPTEVNNASKAISFRHGGLGWYLLNCTPKVVYAVHPFG